MASPPAVKGEEGDSEDWLITYADAITLLMAFFVMMFSISEVSQDKYEEVAGGILSEMSGKQASVAQPFKTILSQQMENREEGEGKMDAEATRRGMTFNFDSKDIFKSGSAELIRSAVPKLDRAAQMITLLGIQNYQVDVEGHTDDVPLSGKGRYPTNWELSASRATNVVKFLISRGVDPTRLRAIGYADTKPREPNRDANGRPIRENQAKNRRVTIRVER